MTKKQVKLELIKIIKDSDKAAQLEPTANFEDLFEYIRIIISYLYLEKESLEREKTKLLEKLGGKNGKF